MSGVAVKAAVVSRRVHIYATVRVPVDVPVSDAATHEEAMRLALDQTDLRGLLEGNGFEYAEEVSGFLVDDKDAADELIGDGTVYGSQLECQG